MIVIVRDGGLCLSTSAQTERAEAAFECLPRPREIDYFEKECIISLFRPPLEEVGGPTHT